MKPVATCMHAFLTLDAASILFSGSDWLIGRAYVSYDWFTFYGTFSFNAEFCLRWHPTLPSQRPALQPSVQAEVVKSRTTGARVQLYTWQKNSCLFLPLNSHPPCKAVSLAESLRANKELRTAGTRPLSSSGTSTLRDCACSYTSSKTLHISLPVDSAHALLSPLGSFCPPLPFNESIWSLRALSILVSNKRVKRFIFAGLSPLSSLRPLPLVQRLPSTVTRRPRSFSSKFLWEEGEGDLLSLRELLNTPEEKTKARNLGLLSSQKVVPTFMCKSLVLHKTEGSHPFLNTTRRKWGRVYRHEKAIKC